MSKDPADPGTIDLEDHLGTRPLNAKVWAKEEHGHYVEPRWVSRRLFEEEDFEGVIYDPACGFGRIVQEAQKYGYTAAGTDIVDRSNGKYEIRDYMGVSNFIDIASNVVSNPPYHIFKEFTQTAIYRAHRKVALVCPTRRLNAARWLEDMPLTTVWLLTPRPSMPPGYVVKELEDKNKHPSGGTQDFCWLVFDKSLAHIRMPEIRWLCRDAHVTT